MVRLMALGETRTTNLSAGSWIFHRYTTRPLLCLCEAWGNFTLLGHWKAGAGTIVTTGKATPSNSINSFRQLIPHSPLIVPTHLAFSSFKICALNENSKRSKDINQSARELKKGGHVTLRNANYTVITHMTSTSLSPNTLNGVLWSFKRPLKKSKRYIKLSQSSETDPALPHCLPSLWEKERVLSSALFREKESALFSTT